MTKAEHLEQRTKLLDEAQNALDTNDIEKARELREEVEMLDKAFEEEALMMANAKAMEEPTPIEDITNMIVEPMEEETMENIVKANYHDSFYKKLMGLEMTDEEKVIMQNATSATHGAVIPEETQAEIIRKAVEVAPLLGEVTLLNVAGNVRFAVEGAKVDAEVHKENAKNTAADNAIVEVSLAGFEITRLIQISDTVNTMSIATFEGWLTDMLVESIANKAVDLIINGTGSGEGKGLAKASMAEVKGAITNANVRKMIAELNGGYDANAKILMSKKTFFNSVAALQDDKTGPMVRYEGITNLPYVYGYPVMFDARVPEGTIYLGDFKKVVANLGEAINVKTGFDIDTNSYKYLGVAIFDCQLAIDEAFVKLIPNA